MAALSAQAQVNVNSSPNIVGSGARALGMGGAFIAIADDATAASWNPGGLTQLEAPEISIVYSWKWIEEDFDSWSHPELGGSFDVNFDDLNYLSVVYPIPWTFGGRNFVLGLNYQKQYDFDRKLKINFKDITALPFGNIFDIFTRVNYSQNGSLASLSPAFGFEVTDKLSLGVVANIWDESLLPSNEWKERTQFRTRFRINGATPTYSWGEINENYDNFDGTNYTLGLLYKPNDRWGFGAVYHTKFAADVDYTQVFRTRPGFAVTYSREDRRIEWPSAYGAGVSYRFPNDKLTLSLDLTRRNWDEFVESDAFGTRRSPISGELKKYRYHEPTYTLRFGGEYVFVDASKPRQTILPSLRAGLFYDPEPSSNPKDRLWGLARGDGDVDDYYGVTLGLGLLFHNRVNVDMAYQYRWGDEVRKDTFSLPGTAADVEQHTLYMSTVIYF